MKPLLTNFYNNSLPGFFPVSHQPVIQATLMQQSTPVLIADNFQKSASRSGVSLTNLRKTTPEQIAAIKERITKQLTAVEVPVLTDWLATLEKEPLQALLSQVGVTSVEQLIAQAKQAKLIFTNLRDNAENTQADAAGTVRKLGFKLPVFQTMALLQGTPINGKPLDLFALLLPATTTEKRTWLEGFKPAITAGFEREKANILAARNKAALLSSSSSSLN